MAGLAASGRVLEVDFPRPHGVDGALPLRAVRHDAAHDEEGNTRIVLIQVLWWLCLPFGERCWFSGAEVSPLVSWPAFPWSPGGAFAEAPLRVVHVEERTGPLRALVYARTSDPAQKTIWEQVLECRKRCDSRGWKVRYILTDEGQKGDDVERRMYQRMFDLAERKAFDVVVPWKIDRIARSLAQCVVLEEALRAEGAYIHSCTEPVDTTTPVGRFIFGILASAAALENEIRRERIRLGNQRQARRGVWLRGNVPYGYHRDNDGQLQENPDEASVVRQVFKIYRRTKRMTETARVLNDHGLRYRGHSWTNTRVQEVLTKEVVTGKLVQAGIEASCPVILPMPEFQRTRALMRSRPYVGRPLREKTRRRSIARVFDQYVESLRLLNDS